LRKIAAAEPRSGNEIDRIAFQIVKKFQPEVLEKLQNFRMEEFFDLDLESLVGVKTDYTKLPIGVHGYIDSDFPIAVIAVDLMEDACSEYYRNSTIAHETGHAILHVPEFRRKKAVIKSITNEENVNLRLYRETDIPVYMNPEWQAWRFAGALLMPESAIRWAIEKGYGLQKMSDVFRVNTAFVKSRMRALKLL
jgi:Zn-dependent peptidase ImmA (M78 family)